MIRRRAAALLLTVALCRCARDAAAWHHAQELWRTRDATAFASWQSLDPATPTGTEAHRRLRAADAEYRRGIELLEHGDPAARDVLTATADLAPIDPTLYLPFARACHSRGLDDRAAARYRKYLTHAPAGRDADAARDELAALGNDVGRVFECRR